MAEISENASKRLPGAKKRKSRKGTRAQRRGQYHLGIERSVRLAVAGWAQARRARRIEIRWGRRRLQWILANQGEKCVSHRLAS